MTFKDKVSELRKACQDDFLFDKTTQDHLENIILNVFGDIKK